MAEVLIHGVAGGREAALEQAMWASPEVTHVVVDNGDLDGNLGRFGLSEKPFVIIGPEAPAVAGVADELRGLGYVVLGASKDAARYEASKSHSVEMMQDEGIVHPPTVIAKGPDMAERARAYILGNSPDSYVIKADGLAAGKGVVLPETVEEALRVVNGMISGELFGGAGKEIINFAKRKRGREISAMVLVGNGSDDFMVLPLSRDHKRRDEGDKGPNTGGVGAYAPVEVSSPKQQKIYEKAYDSLRGMERRGVRYQNAVLYMGLMESDDLPDDETDILEYNVRLGDPETQVILPLMMRAGVDVYRFFRSAAEGQIERPDVDMANIGHAAVSVCLAANGYPGKPEKGKMIHGLTKDYDEAVSFQLAGVDVSSGQFRTAGGRVLYVTGVGENVDAARDSAYGAIGEHGVWFDGMQYRRDIAGPIWERKAA